MTSSQDLVLDPEAPGAAIIDVQWGAEIEVPLPMVSGAEGALLGMATLVPPSPPPDRPRGCFPGADGRQPPMGKAMSSQRQQPWASRSPSMSTSLSHSHPLPCLSLMNLMGRAGLWVSVVIAIRSSGLGAVAA